MDILNSFIFEHTLGKNLVITLIIS